MTEEKECRYSRACRRAGVDPATLTPEERRAVASQQFIRDYSAGPETFGRAAGSWSAGQPGLQNIPRDTLNYMVQANTADIEMRILAHMLDTEGVTGEGLAQTNTIPDERVLTAESMIETLERAMRDLGDRPPPDIVVGATESLMRDYQQQGRALREARPSPLTVDIESGMRPWLGGMQIRIIDTPGMPEDTVYFVQKSSLKDWKPEDAVALRFETEKTKQEDARKRIWEGKVDKICMGKVSLPGDKQNEKNRQGQPSMLSQLHGQEICVRVTVDKSGGLTLRQITGCNSVLVSPRYCMFLRELTEAEVRQYLNQQKPRRRLNLED